MAKVGDDSQKRQKRLNPVKGGAFAFITSGGHRLPSLYRPARLTNPTGEGKADMNALEEALKKLEARAEEQLIRHLPTSARTDRAAAATDPRRMRMSGRRKR